MSRHLQKLIDQDATDDERLDALERSERPSHLPKRPPAPLPLLGDGRRAHPLTDMQVRTIAACLELCANDVPGINSREALELGLIRRQLLEGIGEAP